VSFLDLVSFTTQRSVYKVSLCYARTGVDDERNIRQTLATALESMNHEVVTASTGEEALCSGSSGRSR